ncbi:MAG: hypothetical protein NTY02_09325 [Acidobacteria bacterium]|nr:hypothetical protein [Acidobacteriota bacterium]
MNWTVKHWIALGMILSSLGAMGANLPTWAAALQPGFVFPAFGAIGAVLVAIYSDNAKP